MKEGEKGISDIYAIHKFKSQRKETILMFMQINVVSYAMHTE